MCAEQSASATADARLHQCSNATVLPEARRLTPDLIAELQQGLPAEKREGSFFAFDSSSFISVIGNNELFVLMDNVSTRAELLRTGRLASLFGMDVLTDAYLAPDSKILPAKRVYVMSGDGTEGRACDIV